jgi:hypothetical protein
MIPVFERVKTFHALDRVAAVIGKTRSASTYTQLDKENEVLKCLVNFMKTRRQAAEND